ncbi:hypothetical protein JCGZ_19346 [Jatropha curcas]|uniref:Uncharacterized protein n=1 Tax=Jatropha curcas TaxID=180498 RepID=A0A067KC41_JATCU|nr:hypothetical protein JCGZ_19346 [Jatropha curcas]
MASLAGPSTSGRLGHSSTFLTLAQSYSRLIPDQGWRPRLGDGTSQTFIPSGTISR